MDIRSQETLRRVQQNDDTLTELHVGNWSETSDDPFNSNDGSDYSKLGAAIGENTNLTWLEVDLSITRLHTRVVLDVVHTGFYDGLKQNKSIYKLSVDCDGHNIVGGVVEEILKAYQENNTHLTHLHIRYAGNIGDNAIATTLRMCTNLKVISLYCCNITGEQLLSIIEAVRCHRSLELFLHNNRIGNDGCYAIATLLRDSNSNLQIINLGNNDIRYDGAVTLANGISNNTKLRELYLDGNSIDQRVMDNFARFLCNTSSINSIYSSNITHLGVLDLIFHSVRHQI